MNTLSGEIKSTLSGDKPTEKEIQEWWRWLLPIPWDRSPLHGGEYVSEGQADAFTWCLVCTGGRAGIGGVDPNIRMLDATSVQKDILIPVHVAAYAKGEINGSPMDAAKDFVKNGNRILEVDGQPLQPHYIETGPFKATIPDNHICDSHLLTRGDHDFYSAGFWLKIVHPKERKKYRIKFGGSKGDFKTEVTYEVRI